MNHYILKPKTGRVLFPYSLFYFILFINYFFKRYQGDDMQVIKQSFIGEKIKFYINNLACANTMAHFMC